MNNDFECSTNNSQLKFFEYFENNFLKHGVLSNNK